MVESIDTITMRTYFRIVCSDPFDLSPLGKGTQEQREAAWKKIVEEDAKMNTHGSYSQTVELLEARDRAAIRSLRIYACMVAISHGDTDSIEILRSLGIEANAGQDLMAIAHERRVGLQSKIDEIDKEVGERKRPTLKECYVEMEVLNSYGHKLTGDSTLIEYRAVQDLVRKQNAKNDEQPNN